MRHFLLILALMAAPAWAVQPDEVLDDPVLEQRARDISAGLRCPVCQNESIDESNAGISGDLRVKLRERLVAGDSDEEAVQFLVDRYGEFILFSPPKEGANLVLWLAGPLLLLVAAGVGFASVRARAAAKGPENLSSDEQARLDEIMRS
ncbi:MAG: cytochrome c-type biogenesis protein [Salibaculum sp.]|jgi:cytochrome c-type biogenesis protein CcmH|uniref:cytochrome c-type biogenesis protein n=1 Tax=Salibaculum sp. TaxID=2855480 RepID=UPI00286FD245|nr:cytochrome c-type biogenesis protein [Salibaculum sp.]MDR9428068.1 cytochrome c-type biogenesis protein [Salibaculum sp.]MDR9482293.1 cytochrome c-type biogenesis protein [Salibaculum sp.]